MDGYIVYDMATGEIRWRAQGDAASQKLPDGLSAIPLPLTALGGDEELATVQSALCTKIDAECGAVRRQFVTDITGQAATYQLKLAEAKAWTSGDDPTNYPYLGRESVKRDMSMADLVDEVLATGALWVGVIDPELESERVAAKKAVNMAETVSAALLAGQVDWSGLLAAL